MHENRNVLLFLLKKFWRVFFEKRLSETSDDFSYIYHSQFSVFAFVYKNENGWVVDKQMPILTQNRQYFFDKLPIMKGVEL